MEESNWKTIGWAITKKLVYYFLALTLLSLLATFAFSLMTAANTLLFIGGGLLFVVTLGVGIAILIREILYFASKLN